MKKLILFIAMATILNSAIAQTKSQIISFLSERTMPFNQGAKMIAVNNIDSLIRDLKKKDISYSYNTFVFYGNKISTETEMGGSGKTRIHSKKIPFVFFNNYKSNGNIVIEVVSGSDSW